MSIVETAQSPLGPASVDSLEMLLDYAIAEGAALRLPAFVLLLRMAQLELRQTDGHKHAGLRPRLARAE